MIYKRLTFVFWWLQKADKLNVGRYLRASELQPVNQGVTKCINLCILLSLIKYYVQNYAFPFTVVLSLLSFSRFFVHFSLLRSQFQPDMHAVFRGVGQCHLVRHCCVSFVPFPFWHRRLKHVQNHGQPKFNLQHRQPLPQTHCERACRGHCNVHTRTIKRKHCVSTRVPINESPKQVVAVNPARSLPSLPSLPNCTNMNQHEPTQTNTHQHKPTQTNTTQHTPTTQLHNPIYLVCPHWNEGRRSRWAK